MGTELEQYKATRINTLKNKFSYDKSVLTKHFNTLINNVLRYRVRNKPAQINNLRASYTKQINNLTNQLNNAINIVNAYQPTVVEIIKSSRALLIGCNYNGSQYQLNGCINDVKNVQTLINKHGFNNVTLLTDESEQKPNKSTILNEFKNLLMNSNSGDLLFFSYSGHGSYVLDKNGDEKDGYDELIVPLDLNVITDDELKTIIQAYLKPNVTLFSLFDCCFSGSVLDLKYQYLDSLNYDNYTENNNTNDTLGNVIMISGCTDKQTSADAFINNISQGAMTWSFIESVNNNPNLSWRELIKNMRDLLKNSNYDQIPQLSTGQIFNIDSKIFI
jgi:hypothetical protein